LSTPIISALYTNNLTIIKDENLEMIIMVINMHEDKLYDMACKRVDEKIKVYRHLFTYVVVMTLLFIVNFVCTPEYWWVLWVGLFWGIGVIFDFLKVFVLYEKFDDRYRDKMIEKEISSMNY